MFYNYEVASASRKDDHTKCGKMGKAKEECYRVRDFNPHS